MVAKLPKCQNLPKSLLLEWIILSEFSKGDQLISIKKRDEGNTPHVYCLPIQSSFMVPPNLMAYRSNNLSIIYTALPYSGQARTGAWNSHSLI